VSADGGTIVVGATLPNSTLREGAVYVYLRAAGYWGGGWALAQNAKLTPGPVANYSNFGGFGTSVSIADNGATIVVGSPYHSTTNGWYPDGADGQNPGPQTVTLTNVGAGPLNVASVSVNGPFTSTQNCLAASPLAPGSSCSEQIAYVPISTALATGTLTFTDNSAGIIGATQQVSLQGYGIKVKTSTAITARVG